MKTEKLTFERLLEALHYDPGKGVFTWMIDRTSIGIGDRAGSNARADGYRYIRIDGVLYRASRLALFYTNGEWPPEHVDHINGDTADDRFDNLRGASRSQNLGNRKRGKNNTSGAKGVYHGGDGKYRVSVSKNNVRHYVGTFYSFEAAQAAYAKTAEHLHGEFARMD